MTIDTTATDARIGVDVGGTFTDVALSVGDRLVTAKVPTTDPQHRGVLEGIDKACADAGIEPHEIEGFAHAMTVSVNALLERDGAKTALVTTEGFPASRTTLGSNFRIQCCCCLPLASR